MTYLIMCDRRYVVDVDSQSMQTSDNKSDALRIDDYASAQADIAQQLSLF